MLKQIKLILGIKDEKHDGILKIILDAVVGYALTYCHLTTLPDGAKAVVTLIVAEQYRMAGYGDDSRVVKSITDGEEKIEFDTAVEAAKLAQYKAMLEPYRCRKALLPSDVSQIKEAEKNETKKIR